MEDNIVVSEIGEQWSPKTDPDKTEANVAKNMGDSTVASGDIFKRCIAIGTTTGTNIDIVAQDEPVEKLMAAAVIKVMKGSMAGDKILEEILTKYSAVFRSLHTEPMVHANTKIIQAITIDLTPFTHASNVFSKVNIFRPIGNPIAEILENEAPQIRLA